HLLAGLQTLQYHYLSFAALAGGDEAAANHQAGLVILPILRRFAVGRLDDIHRLAVEAEGDGRLRYHHPGLSVRQQDVQLGEHAGQQLLLRIADPGAHQQGTGTGVHPRVDRGDLSGEPLIRKSRDAELTFWPTLSRGKYCSARLKSTLRLDR